MRIELNPEVRSLLAQIAVLVAAADRRVWATGGIVRDALRGVGSRDIDLAIEGDSIEFGRNLADSVKGHFVVLDKKRGHVRIVLDSPRAQIDMASLRAEAIEGDLEQRDYTINAIAVEVGEFAAGDLAEFIDPTRGQDDLASRTVKATSEAALQDDPVRLLRGVRLATELDFSVDESTAEMIRRNAGLIEGTAAERVREELVKILATDQAAEGLRTMDALGLFAHVLPEMEVARGVEQPKEHSFDVLEHCLAAC